MSLLKVRSLMARHAYGSQTTSCCGMRPKGSELRADLTLTRCCQTHIHTQLGGLATSLSLCLEEVPRYDKCDEAVLLHFC
eukprot:1907092-Amphidinium_carterae.1